MEDDNVTKLPVRFKTRAPNDRTVVAGWEVHNGGGCPHLNVTYIVDDALAEVECGNCGAKLNPMWVLTRIASEDRHMAETQERYHDEMRRLEQRSRTKCTHCGRMTRISRA